MLEFNSLIFIIGTITLLKLTWSDLNTLLVDARTSYLMMGVVFSCYFLTGRVIEMLLIGVIFLFLLDKIKKHSDLIGLGDGDVTILSWLIPGTFFLGYWFLVIFLIGYVLILLTLKYLLKKNSGIPLTIPLTIAFMLTWIAFIYI